MSVVQTASIMGAFVFAIIVPETPRVSSGFSGAFVCTNHIREGMKMVWYTPSLLSRMYIYYLKEEPMGVPKFHNSGLYFESVTANEKKHFKISFPIDIYLSLNWAEEEREALMEYDKSEFISDKLLMLALIASKIEAKPKPNKEAHGIEEA